MDFIYNFIEIVLVALAPVSAFILVGYRLCVKFLSVKSQCSDTYLDYISLDYISLTNLASFGNGEFIAICLLYCISS
jgi:hypothetical protein